MTMPNTVATISAVSSTAPAVHGAQRGARSAGSTPSGSSGSGGGAGCAKGSTAVICSRTIGREQPAQIRHGRNAGRCGGAVADHQGGTQAGAPRALHVGLDAVADVQ